MKRLVMSISVVMVMFAIARLVSVRAQNASAPEQDAKNGAPPPANPLKVAILHWYQANLTTSLKVGKQPYAVAFDGENVWSANYEDGTATKLRASDGENLGTFTVGDEPDAIAFDGTYIWVTGGHTVSRLKENGANAGTFNVESQPTGIAFDGANIWVANSSGGSVTKLRAKDGTNLGTFSYPGSPYGVAFDGNNIWVSGSPYVVEYRATDGTMLDMFHINGSSTAGVAFDGANIWVAATYNNAVNKF